MPPVELVIIFVINGKEVGERSLEVNLNQEFKSFEVQLVKLCKPKLPRGLTIISDGVDFSFKRAYVTKAQEAKRKDLNWKDFEDAEDYSGLLNVVRNSKTTKMTLVFRAFIIVPKEDFEAEIEPALASQRVVCSPLIGVDNRLLLLSKRPLWHQLLSLLTTRYFPVLNSGPPVFVFDL